MVVPQQGALVSNCAPPGLRRPDGSSIRPQGLGRRGPRSSTRTPARDLVVEGSEVLRPGRAYAPAGVGTETSGPADRGRHGFGRVPARPPRAHQQAPRGQAEATARLVPGGHLVSDGARPPRLWSAADETSATSAGTRGRARRRPPPGDQQGFELRYLSHIFSWLVVPVWVKRRPRPGGGPETGLDVASPFVDGVRPCSPASKPGSSRGSSCRPALRSCAWPSVRCAPRPIRTSTKRAADPRL